MCTHESTHKYICTYTHDYICTHRCTHRWCIYPCVCIHMIISTHIDTHMWCIYISTFVHTHDYIHTYRYTHVMYIYIYMCVYMCLYLHSWMRTQVMYVHLLMSSHINPHTDNAYLHVCTHTHTWLMWTGDLYIYMCTQIVDLCCRQSAQNVRLMSLSGHNDNNGGRWFTCHPDRL